MQTRNSIDLSKVSEPCAFIIAGGRGCLVRESLHAGCGSKHCPFYKPEGCRDWVRIEDKDGVNLVPPEEYRTARLAVKKRRDVITWRIVHERT